MRWLLDEGLKVSSRYFWVINHRKYFKYMRMSFENDAYLESLPKVKLYGWTDLETVYTTVCGRVNLQAELKFLSELCRIEIRTFSAFVYYKNNLYFPNKRALNRSLTFRRNRAMLTSVLVLLIPLWSINYRYFFNLANFCYFKF